MRGCEVLEEEVRNRFCHFLDESEARLREHASNSVRDYRIIDRVLTFPEVKTRLVGNAISRSISTGCVVVRSRR